MKEIKVWLQYPWKFPDSSYYKNTLDFPPKDVNYVNYKKNTKKPHMEVIGSSKEFERMRKFKNIIRRILKFFSLPNLTFTKKGNYDLIHCAHCITFTKKPWVVDSEVYGRLASSGAGNKGFGKWLIKKSLESNSCKKIIAWSDDCWQTFVDAFPNNKKILDKLVHIPFALPKPKYKKKKHKKLRVLFVARWFDAKGGRQTLEVFDRLSQKHPEAEFIFLCTAPIEYKKKYKNHKSIKILDLMPQEEVFEKYYTTSDIFFYPGFGDSYGFAVPEALTYGIPVISTKTFAKSELVKDGKTGFLIDMPNGWDNMVDKYLCMDETMLQSFVDKTSKLIKDKKLREKMSKEAAKEGVTGLFSIEKRNKKLQDVYKAALKK